VAEYLRCCGGLRRVGLFTSPHLRDVRERVRIDGAMIGRDRFAGYVKEVRDFLEDCGGGATYFEVLTLIALKFFVDEGADYAVLEVGLGGRLDCTNIVVPELSILTFVEMEHVGILGDSLGEILDEKLGIVKEEVPLLVGAQSEEVMGLLKRKLSRKVDVHYVDDFRSEIEGLSLDGVDLAGIKNAEVSYCALKILLGGVEKELFERVFKEFRMEGRFDVREIGGKTVVFDVAHTVGSISNLIRSLKAEFPDKKYVFLVSFLEDKDKEGMMKWIDEVAQEVNVGKNIEGESVEVVYKNSLKNLKRDQILVVTGSHYLVGKLLS
jgi:dihydrofolate synthase/folylpolyglutamate synthase